MEAGRAKFFPSPLLVRLAGIGTLTAAVALPFPSITSVAWTFLLLIIVLAAIDWLVSRIDPTPELDRLIPSHLVKGRAVTFVYRLRRCAGDDTVVDLLDELPAALGGDSLVGPAKLGRGQRLEVSHEVVPNRRGTFPMGPTMMRWRSRFGLFSLRKRFQLGPTVVILPAGSMPQRRIGISHRSLRDELGIRPKVARGEGREFESLREYVPGDDQRHIDWRASARHTRLQVRQYQTERHHIVMIALDTGRLMGAMVDGESKLDHAINCGAALARASAGLGDRVGFVAFDRQLRLFVRPKSGRPGAGAAIEATSALTPAPFEPNYRILVETLARSQKKRALLILLTDFVEGGASRDLEDYLAVLAKRHLVMLVAMRDRMLHEVDQREPGISRDRLYRRLALQDLVAERETALARISRFGAQVLDLDPAQITAPVLNRYLAIREAALI
jgi:uncharacterized protein (DUF58 family)